MKDESGTILGLLAFFGIGYLIFRKKEKPLKADTTGDAIVEKQVEVSTSKQATGNQNNWQTNMFKTTNSIDENKGL